MKIVFAFGTLGLLLNACASNSGGSTTGMGGRPASGGAGIGGLNGSGGATSQAGGRGDTGGANASGGPGGSATGGFGGQAGVASGGGGSPADSGIGGQAGPVFYVSPTGSDSSPGTAAQPFQTIGRARDVVRTVNGNMTSDITVYLHGGVYNLTATVSFGSADSGTNGYRVRYQAYPGETPIIMAATLITGWNQYNGQIFRAPFSRSTKLRSLYVNEKRAYMASKTMNCHGSWGSYAVTAGSAPWAWSTGSQADGVEYSLTDLPAITNNVSDIEIESSSTWNTSIVGVREVTSDGTNRIVKLQQPYGAIAQRVDSGAGFATGSGSSHKVSNAYEFLDTPGEFYFDRTNGYVYYDAATNEDMTKATVYAPSGLETLISVAGTSTSSRAKNLTFQGLTFKYTDWQLFNVAGSAGRAGVQGASAQIAYEEGQYQAGYMRRDDLGPDAIAVTSADSIVFERNVVAHTGSDGIGFINDVSNSQLIGNVLYDTGGSAIVVSFPQHVYIGDGGTHEKYQPGIEGKCSNDLIKDNVIYRPATLFKGAGGIMAYYPDTLTVSHNLIDGTPYNGISMGWGWWNFDGSSGSVSPNNPTTTMKNNTVTYNWFYNTMQTLGDSGPIYTLGGQPNTTISNNYMNGVPAGPKYALHQDEGSAYMTIENNVMNTNLNIDHTIEVGTWGRQHDFTYKNNWTRRWGPTIRRIVPNSTFEPIKTYANAIWPVGRVKQHRGRRGHRTRLSGHHSREHHRLAGRRVPRQRDDGRRQHAHDQVHGRRYEHGLVCAERHDGLQPRPDHDQGRGRQHRHRGPGQGRHVSAVCRQLNRLYIDAVRRRAGRSVRGSYAPCQTAFPD